MRTCILCHNSLEPTKTYSPQITVICCRDCQLPKYSTFYKEVYREDCGPNVFATSLRLDEYLVNCYYIPTSNIPAPRTIFYKTVIGVLEGSGDIEPLLHNSAIFRMDEIITLPVHDLELVKYKIEVWATFS